VKPIISIQSLILKREQRTILEIDEYFIYPGEVLAVVGPNGAGKSTLLMALARLLKPAAGKILFDGKSIWDIPDTEYRRKISLVMQDPLLFDRSVFDNVAMGLRFRGTPARETTQKVNHWLEKLNIALFTRRNAMKISGGEAQRVSLARALVLQPNLLLLDEPFAALDPPTRLNLLNDLRSILSMGKITTVFITHNLGEAKALADRMMLIHEGGILQSGNIDEIWKNPKNEAVINFLYQI
jgi:tungstate transport system ATP-binding protein